MFSLLILAIVIAGGYFYLKSKGKTVDDVIRGDLRKYYESDTPEVDKEADDVDPHYGLTPSQVNDLRNHWEMMSPSEQAEYGNSFDTFASGRSSPGYTQQR